VEAWAVPGVMVGPVAQEATPEMARMEAGHAEARAPAARGQGGLLDLEDRQVLMEITH